VVDGVLVPLLSGVLIASPVHHIVEGLHAHRHGTYSSMDTRSLFQLLQTDA
jgi:hypothetical protein